MRSSARAGQPNAGLAPNLWLTIGADGTITIVSPAAELGQGSFTSLPLILAEELDADWTQGEAGRSRRSGIDKKYGNPEYGGVMSTTSSFAVRGYFKPMRIAGAQARRVLIDAAAAKWGVPVGELTTEPSVVVHKASGRRHPLRRDRRVRQGPRRNCRRSTTSDLKPAASFRLIGKDCRPRRRAAKVTGAAKYAMDAQVPGMVYAAVLQSPYQGGAPQTVDDTGARQFPASPTW